MRYAPLDVSDHHLFADPYEGNDGATQPAEQLWMPGQAAVENGFITHSGLHVTGLDGPADDHPCPTAYLVLGHQKRADVIEAAAAYMAGVHGWRNLLLYPGDLRPGGAHPPHPARRSHPRSLLTAPAPGTQRATARAPRTSGC
ncbi:hypothetical protein ABZ626_36895 [Streptomyces longispororuber]|uniref:hypothetical protein n=1 Tax=Streptomyces longispororuber TaxID=68230 RepID=UPI00340196DF